MRKRCDVTIGAIWRHLAPGSALPDSWVMDDERPASARRDTDSVGTPSTPTTGLLPGDPEALSRTDLGVESRPGPGAVGAAPVATSSSPQLGLLHRRPPSWRIALCAIETHVDEGELLGEERAMVAGALKARRSQFATGRWCARVALGEVAEMGDVPLLTDEHGAPQWPPGFVGSITHTASWTAAVACRQGWRAGIRSIGLDAEDAAPLPPGVLEVVASRRERGDVHRLTTADPGTPWDTVLFTAKEATYKAWYPLAAVVLSHDDIHVRLSRDGRFSATVRLSAGRAARGARRVRGRWTVGPRVVVSLGVVD